eukprot:scaffold665_cov341-Prasinococcus_capsulatus_cf.AAC.13
MDSGEARASKQASLGIPVRQRLSVLARLATSPTTTWTRGDTALAGGMGLPEKEKATIELEVPLTWTCIKLRSWAVVAEASTTGSPAEPTFIS